MSGDRRVNLYTDKTTAEVAADISELKDTDALNSYILEGKRHGESFGIFLSKLMRDRGLTVPELSGFTHNQISESYLYKLLEDRKSVSRENVIRIGIALLADLPTMNALLKMAGYGSLGRGSIGDMVVEYAINKHYEDHDAFWIEENLEKNHAEYTLFPRKSDEV